MLCDMHNQRNEPTTTNCLCLSTTDCSAQHYNQPYPHIHTNNNAQRNTSNSSRRPTDQNLAKTETHNQINSHRQANRICTVKHAANQNTEAAQTKHTAKVNDIISQLHSAPNVVSHFDVVLPAWLAVKRQYLPVIQSIAKTERNKHAQTQTTIQSSTRHTQQEDLNIK